MIPRLLKNIAFDPKFGRQMRFVAGPRQTGKTTLAKVVLKETGSEALYYNWDQRKTRSLYKTNPYFFVADAGPAKGEKKWLCFNEIHKMPKWKNILKDYFDGYEESFQFIVTGSARLDLFRKSGDSLAGRYFLFKLFPLLLAEYLSRDRLQLAAPPESARHFVEKRISGGVCHQEAMENLLRFSGFPEPLLNGTEEFHFHWQQEYLDRLVRIDLRDLTKIHELENVATLVGLIAGRVGSPLSLNSLREDLEVSHTAVRNYLEALKLCYIVFLVPPYSKKIQRTVKKEPKVYFFDWTHVKNEAARFENYVALELYSLINLWMDAGFGKYELRVVRMRDKRETDFLILKNNRPWCLAEAKLSVVPFEAHHLHHASLLGDIPLIQVVREANICKVFSPVRYAVSAGRFFAGGVE